MQTRTPTPKDRIMKSKNTICLWFNKDALEAARFYAATFPDSKVGTTYKAPGDYPSGKEGDVLMVEFTVLGIPCLGLNGGLAFKHSEAFSTFMPDQSGKAPAGLLCPAKARAGLSGDNR